MTYNTWDEGGMSCVIINIENHIDICFIGISKDIYKMHIFPASRYELGSQLKQFESPSKYSLFTILQANDDVNVCLS